MTKFYGLKFPECKKNTQKECKYFTLCFSVNLSTCTFAANQTTMAKKTKTNTFVLSDESVNSYGSIVITAGIDTAQFERNPVMLYMHDRANGIIGCWENIRKEGDKLLADAVFDDSSELGAKVKKQVENGFLRCVSIGIDVLEQSELNGVQTIVKSRLIEVSMVDIPSNANAVKLFHVPGSQSRKFIGNDNTDPEVFRASIIALLGLEPDASNTDILREIEKAVRSEENTEELLNNAVSRGYIDAAQRDNFRTMAQGNPRALMAYIDTQRMTEAKDVEAMVRTATGTGKILSYESDIYRRIGETMGARTLRELLDTLPGAAKPLDFIRASQDRKGWTLKDYRKFAPKELRDNPDLYAQLLKEETGRTVGAHTLEWYRRNNPEYLRENPDVYSELLERERKNKLNNN